MIVVASFVSPYKSSRDFARHQAKNFIEVYLQATPEECESRDDRSRYAKARAGLLKYFPGVGVPYETSPDPEITIDVSSTSEEEATNIVESYLVNKFIGVG